MPQTLSGTAQRKMRIMVKRRNVVRRILEEPRAAISGPNPLLAVAIKRGFENESLGYSVYHIPSGLEAIPPNTAQYKRRLTKAQAIELMEALARLDWNVTREGCGGPELAKLGRLERDVRSLLKSLS
jgi:hypothetical protein